MLESMMNPTYRLSPTTTIQGQVFSIHLLPPPFTLKIDINMEKRLKNHPTFRKIVSWRSSPKFSSATNCGNRANRGDTAMSKLRGCKENTTTRQERRSLTAKVPTMQNNIKNKGTSGTFNWIWYTFHHVQVKQCSHVFYSVSETLWTRANIRSCLSKWETRPQLKMSLTFTQHGASEFWLLKHQAFASGNVSTEFWTWSQETTLEASATKT